MNSRLFVILLVGCIAYSQARAEDITAPCDAGQSCIDPNSWQLGVAVGMGGRTNPLVDGDTIPYFLLPDIAYYGDAFYFDNGEIGVQFYPSASTSFELFAIPNAERANFSFWHSANILIPAATLSNAGLANAQQKEDMQVSVDDVASRKWAIDAGARWQWHNANHHVRVTLARDISGVYQGIHGAVAYLFTAQLSPRLRLNISPQIAFKGDKLSDYYYGVHANDTPAANQLYTATGGFQVGVDLSTLYRINDHWRFLTRLGATRLHDGMADSPLVEDNMVYTLFAGVAYRF